MIYAYNVEFVINISELGEDDPLLQNATQYFNSRKAPWYTTIALNGDGPDYFFKQFNISSGRTLDIVALNTQRYTEELQLKQLSRKLDLSNSNWRIAVVSHPLCCNKSSEQTEAKRNDFLHQTLLKHGVDAYLSGRSCDDEARIGGPYLTAISQGSYPPKEMVNMLLLHRVSPLEITTYGVGFKGDIIYESTVRQRGRDTIEKFLMVPDKVTDYEKDISILDDEGFLEFTGIPDANQTTPPARTIDYLKIKDESASQRMKVNGCGVAHLHL
ncbi:hypothetical protein SSX86_026243 [Deinandra increscens subsp. villosa]|uniref:Uncharacterized protein n=1 Tax=Deinandra increscens subsp. villosa TaxID=3103831 RepID=A0AAP0CFK5_9ASTR